MGKRLFKAFTKPRTPFDIDDDDDDDDDEQADRDWKDTNRDSSGDDVSTENAASTKSSTKLRSLPAVKPTKSQSAVKPITSRPNSEGSKSIRSITTPPQSIKNDALPSSKKKDTKDNKTPKKKASSCSAFFLLTVMFLSVGSVIALGCYFVMQGVPDVGNDDLDQAPCPTCNARKCDFIQWDNITSKCSAEITFQSTSLWPWDLVYLNVSLKHEKCRDYIPANAFWGNFDPTVDICADDQLAKCSNSGCFLRFDVHSPTGLKKFTLGNDSCTFERSSGENKASLKVTCPVICKS